MSIDCVRRIPCISIYAGKIKVDNKMHTKLVKLQ